MQLKHEVRINIADGSGHKQEILRSSHISLPKKLLTFLFGEFCEVLVMTPGKTVRGIEITETREENRDRGLRMENTSQSRSPAKG